MEETVPAVEEKDVVDCVALVQGASRGIGLEFVRQLSARPSTQVIAACRRPDQAQALRQVAEAAKCVSTVALDISQESSVADAAERIATLTDRLDLVINVAGLLHQKDQAPERRLSEVNATALQNSFAVNATGPILLARYVEPLLAKGQRAVFASLSARVGSIEDNRLGGWYAYRASKAAQNMLIKTLSIEWRRRRRPIVCIAMHPGTVDTDLSRPFLGRTAPERVFSPQRAVTQLLDIIDGATVDDSGSFFAWNGETISW